MARIADQSELRDKARQSIAEAQERPKPKPSDYVWDAFISYRRDPEFNTWMTTVFGILKRELANHLGGKSEIFMDVREIKSGDIWPEDLKSALQTSRCLIPFVEPRYFASNYCNAEFETFLVRGAPIIPLVVGGRASLSAKVTQFQVIDIEKYHLQTLSFQNNQRAEELELLLKDKAGEIAEKIRSAPHFRPDFFVPDLATEPARRMKPTRRPTRKKKPSSLDRRVFLNVPFSEAYRPLFDAIVFTLLSGGYDPRTVVSKRGTEVRLDAILRLINECTFSIHDLSEQRGNAILELGMFLAARQSGRKRKDFIILLSEPYRHYREISDLSGIDVSAHRSDPQTAMLILRNWLATRPQMISPLPSAASLWSAYRDFRSELPRILEKLGAVNTPLGYTDVIFLVREWLKRGL